MHIVTQFPHRIIENPDLGVRMQDGCRLSARLWMPEDAADNPVPAILEYIPYRKRDGTVERDEIMHRYFAAHGYAVVRLDLRGSGESRGILHDEYTETELHDGTDAIAWIAAQDWCDGNVGMMGKSWGGFNCLQVAMRRPEALKAIITVCSTTDRYADDIHYKGGCLLNDNFLWGAGQMLSYSSRPPDPALVGDDWRTMWLERLETAPLLAARWLRHQRRDDYWKHGSVCEDWGAIRAAVLSFGGWADNYMNTVAHLVENLEAPVKGIVGPWVHQYPHTAGPGPQIGFLQEALRWWDYWLKGVETGVLDDPAYRVWQQDSTRPARQREYRPGRWLAMAKWPGDRTQAQAWHLGQDGHLNDAPEQIEIQVNSPMDCGFGSGLYFPMASNVPQMSGDQRDDDARSACFETAVLDAPLDIVGAPLVHLRLKADRPAAQIAIRLSEVHADGASNRLTYGVLNLCHRNGHEAPEAIVPGEEIQITLRLDQMAARVAPGMRLRLAVSSAYWPFLWPSPDRATLTLLGGRIELPLCADVTGDEWQFDEAEGAEPWAHKALRPALYERNRSHDLGTGEITLHTTNDEGLNEDAAHGLISGALIRETLTIHPDDPLSATADVKWTQELKRGPWDIRTETAARMWSDADTFYLAARIEAFEGGELVFETDFEEQIPRDHV